MARKRRDTFNEMQAWDKEVKRAFKAWDKEVEMAFKPPKGWRSTWGDFGTLSRGAVQKEKRKKRRTPIPLRTQKRLLLRSKAKCEKCGTKLGKGLMPDFHHKNENPSDHRMGNILVLCPNCHRKETNRLRGRVEKRKAKPKRKKRTTKRKVTKRKTSRRKRTPEDEFKRIFGL